MNKEDVVVVDVVVDDDDDDDDDTFLVLLSWPLGLLELLEPEDGLLLLYFSRPLGSISLFFLRLSLCLSLSCLGPSLVSLVSLDIGLPLSSLSLLLYSLGLGGPSLSIFFIFGLSPLSTPSLLGLRILSLHLY